MVLDYKYNLFNLFNPDFFIIKLFNLNKKKTNGKLLM